MGQASGHGSVVAAHTGVSTAERRRLSPAVEIVVENGGAGHPLDWSGGWRAAASALYAPACTEVLACKPYLAGLVRMYAAARMSSSSMFSTQRGSRQQGGSQVRSL